MSDPLSAQGSAGKRFISDWNSMQHNTANPAAIGAIGHRQITQQQVIIPAIDEALVAFKRLFGCSQLTVVSSLAEGADRLIAQRCLRHPDCRLIALLPMPAKRYAQDFDSDASKEEFHMLLDLATRVITLPSGEDRIEAYQKAALCLLDSSTALLAIWDGRPARGPGGTAETIMLARQREMPLVWIFAGAAGFADTLGHLEQPKVGDIVFENWSVGPG